MISRLKKGDLIDILAPGSFIDEEENFQKGIEILKNWGLEINKNTSLSKKFGYFAGDDSTRFEELEKAQNSKLIIFAKGGWGSARLLEKNPSWQHGLMLGFSDTCSLLLSKYSQGFIGSIHGPMVTGLFKEPEWRLERFRNLLFEGYVADIRGIPLRGGKAKGEIIYNIKKGGTIVLNRDDNFFEFFENIAKQNNIKIKSFGFSQKSDVRYIKSKKRKNHFIIKILVKGKTILLKTNNIIS